MIQGSNMNRDNKGMRKGISLLELLIAIVLLGILSGVGFKYYKVYFDTSFAAKQAKMYIIIEQAQQLSGAHQLFDTKNGLAPLNIHYMVADKQITKIPPVMPEVSYSGWKLKTYQDNAIYGTDVNATQDGNISIDIVYAASTANDIAFSLALDNNATTTQDKLDFCNIINNTGVRTWSLNTPIDTYKSIGTAGADEPNDMYALAISADQNVSEDIFCYSADSTSVDANLTILFPVLVDNTN